MYKIYNFPAGHNILFQTKDYHLYTFYLLINFNSIITRSYMTFLIVGVFTFQIYKFCLSKSY